MKNIATIDRNITPKTIVFDKNTTENNDCSTIDTNNNIDDDYILKLFNLHRQDIESFHVIHQFDGVHVMVSLNRKEYTCPVCGFKTNKIKGYTKKKITHSVLTNTPCFIDYRARRYICPACNKTFYEHNPFTMEGMRISLQTVYNVLKDLKHYNETFTSVGRRYNISPVTAATIFDRHVQISRKKLPEYLLLDEVYAFHSEKSDYCCVLLDFMTQQVIDILPSRRKSALLDYLSLIPREERANVKMVAFDMWETYRVVSKMMFPNSIAGVDKFHVIQDLNRRLNRVRTRVMNKVRVNKDIDIKTLPPDERELIIERRKQYYVLKKFHWLLIKNDITLLDPNAKKKYNTVLGGYYNYDDLLNYMVDIDDDLDFAWGLKDAIIDFYKNCTYEKAGKELTKLIRYFRETPVVEMNAFASTLTNWKKEIINSFIIIEEKTKRKINTSALENRNRTIKCIKHNSNGYSHWPRFRNRILFVLNSDETFMLYPSIQKEK